MKHTPGKWNLELTEKGELEIGGAHNAYTPIWDENFHYVIAHVLCHDFDKDAFKAHAELIASAPDLLRLLEMIIEDRNKPQAVLLNISVAQNYLQEKGLILKAETINPK